LIAFLPYDNAIFYFSTFLKKLLQADHQRIKMKGEKKATLKKGRKKCLTHYRPAMPFGNRKTYFRASF